jgi:hypothetical protein
MHVHRVPAGSSQGQHGSSQPNLLSMKKRRTPVLDRPAKFNARPHDVQWAGVQLI